MKLNSGLTEPKADSTQRDTPDKRTLYKTARATIGCSLFKKGDFVSVEYYEQNSDGVHYFLCSKSIGARQACYPEHHLTNFVL